MRIAGHACLAVLLPVLSLACSSGIETPVAPRPDFPMDMAYQLEGGRHFLSELRGAPALLVLMRTSDLLSQAYMMEIKKAFPEPNPSIHLLVLTIEQYEAPFVSLYVESEALPFPVGVAEPAVGQGKSALGMIPAIPTTYFINSRGGVEKTVPGAIKSSDILHIARINFTD